MSSKSLDSAKGKDEGPVFDFVEDESECPGGHYNVTPDEVFHGKINKYQVMLNLHFGDKSTVWVCHDNNTEIDKYWALKILSVDASKTSREHLAEDYLKKPIRDMLAEQDLENLRRRATICFPVDKFLVRGPKGIHQCFVYPLLGPKAQPGPMSGNFEIMRYANCLSPRDDKSFADTYYQLVNAVRFIHSQQLCHGRIIPDNVLYQIQGLNGKCVDDACRILRGSKTIYRADATTKPSCKPIKRIHKGAGDWKSRSVCWDRLEWEYLTSDISLIDFGQCFVQSSPPSTLDLPESYQPPELMLKDILGRGTDLWTLGCTLYQLRMGRPLLDFGSTNRIEQLQCIVKTLEPLGGNVKDLENYGCPDLNVTRLSESKFAPALIKEWKLLSVRGLLSPNGFFALEPFIQKEEE
ncbi:unnamed protein product [Clonostachys rosea]|uniref:Protein kinase domain-containing protein n=1 Tax=Bionectria ochroleuca TaxID=29856 RepID=A0ABY6TSF7_BIOOC|nr:unnamed protein product [Clonostachys rosea]